MPTSLIEGTETVVFYSLFILFPQYIMILYGIFAAGVAINIVHRVLFMYKLKWIYLRII